jgi:hypothetical protein
VKFNFQAFWGALFITAVGFVSCGETAHSGSHTFHTPIEYHDFIVDQQNAIIRQMLKLNELYDSGSEAGIRARFDSLQNTSKLCLQNIRSLSTYDNDSTLKRDALLLFQFYDTIFHAEYPRMLEIFLKGDLASEAELLELNSIVSNVGNREKILQDGLVKSQSRFAGEHRFEFSPNGD